MLADESNETEQQYRCVMDGDCYLVNASTWLGPLDLVQPVYGYLMPVLMLITFISNTIIIIVLTRPTMRTPTNTVLTSMAVCDLLTILLPAPWYIYFYSLQALQDIQWTRLSCFTFEFSLETTPQVSIFSSVEYNWRKDLLIVSGYGSHKPPKH